MARAKSAAPPPADCLLVELLTEELPPKSVPVWQCFAEFLLSGLRDAELAVTGEGVRAFVTPRRVAALVPNVLRRQPLKRDQIKGPPVKVFYRPDGAMAPGVAEGFAKKCGVTLAQLGAGLNTVDDAKGAYVVYEYDRVGQPLAALLPGIVEQALARLPVPKRMRWGDGQAAFVRPVHGLIMLHGS